VAGVALQPLLEVSGDEAAARAVLLRALDEELRDFDHADRLSSIEDAGRLWERARMERRCYSRSSCLSS
jgi:hypothetical protein